MNWEEERGKWVVEWAVRERWGLGIGGWGEEEG